MHVACVHAVCSVCHMNAVCACCVYCVWNLCVQYECCVFCVWAYVHAGCVHAVFAVCGVSSRCAPLAVCVRRVLRCVLCFLRVHKLLFMCLVCCLSLRRVCVAAAVLMNM